MQEIPVTIIVLCYNAETTIIDTLESIRHQDYKNISLLIGDDASRDNSVEIARRWIKNNEKRFIECDIICHSNNIGTSKNFDDLMKRVTTQWVKVIAADDTLLSDCISKNVYFVLKNNNISMLYSRVRPFRVNSSSIEFLQEKQSDVRYARELSKMDSSKQYRCLLKRDIVFSPSVFFNADIYKELGGIDTRIRNIEDWPLRLLFSKNGYKIDFMDEVTVNYRIGDSVSHSIGCFFNPNHIKQRAELKRLLIYPNIPKWDLLYFWDEAISSFRYKIIVHLFKNKVSIMSKIVNYALMILSPTAWEKIIIQVLK